MPTIPFVSDFLDKTKFMRLCVGIFILKTATGYKYSSKEEHYMT